MGTTASGYPARKVSPMTSPRLQDAKNDSWGLFYSAALRLFDTDFSAKQPRSAAFVTNGNKRLSPMFLVSGKELGAGLFSYTVVISSQRGRLS
jgi:hypothetical protein